MIWIVALFINDDDLKKLSKLRRVCDKVNLSLFLIRRHPLKVFWAVEL